MFLLLFLPVEKDQVEGRSAKDFDASGPCKTVLKKEVGCALILSGMFNNRSSTDRKSESYET
jgi:hypothetical protein